MTKARDIAGGTNYQPGNVIQVNNMRYDIENGWTVSNSPTIMTPLNQVITPKYANSKIMVQWELHYEAQYNIAFVIYKNGSLQSNGYNTYFGNNFWVGYAAAGYDVDVASTPNRITITYFDTPGSTAQQTYQLGIKSTESNNQTLYLNRAFSSSGNAYEAGVSLGYVMEIKQ